MFPFGGIPRPNWIEINLDNLQSNIRYFRSLLPAGVKILLPVKADAYGHGSLAISFAAMEAGIDFLGVAHLFEGIALRENGVQARILILGPCLESDFPFLIKHNLTPTIQDYKTAKALNTASTPRPAGTPLEEGNSQLKIHIKLDTGMHRFGIRHDDLETVKAICELPNLEVEGLYSHFATADTPEHTAMENQLAKFDTLVKELEKAGMRPPLCHIANSPATLLFKDKTHYDMVRPGVALYGYDPLGEIPSRFAIKPVLKLRSTIRALREVEAGEGISYGHFFVAKKNMRIATIAIGYGDGYLRGEPNQGVIFIRGKACPILGRVCMDACMVDVSEIPDVQIGDIAECMDGEYSGQISVESFAAEHKTISYEITTRMARRLYRIYRYKSEIGGWNDVKSKIVFPIN
ncbi:MAG: alanine racemase [Fibromonadaceae bacterium]|jgi:alanine racemase|nr:alanine racemase [Fibromonadaceae bacterium]